VIPRLITIVDELLGAVASRANVLVPMVRELSIVGVAEPVPMRGSGAGLVVEQFDQFPELLRLTFRGRIEKGSLVQNPPAMSALQVTVRFRRMGNPALSGDVQGFVTPEADGSFTIPVSLVFDANVPRPTELRGMALIEGSSAPVEDVPLEVTNASLDWFLGLLDRWEPAAQASSRLVFVAMIRKSFLTSADFNAAIGRHLKVQPLHQKLSYWGERLKVGYHVRFGGEAISVSHVLIGIEGGRIQDPRPSVPLARVDLLVTWAGDLGGALTRHLVETYYRENPEALSLEQYLERTASRADLIGDLDGVNLSFEYDPARSLAENFRTYYAGSGRRRFSRFLEVTETDTGQRALAVEPSGGPPRLTEASKQFIAEQILRAAQAPLVRRTALSPDLPPEKRRQVPPVVEAALRTGSPEIQKLTKTFVDFLEQGLAAEGL
jgi:hypothetical protein